MNVLRQLGDYVMNMAGEHPVLTGVVPPIVGTGVSLMEQLEVWMRIGSMGLGMVAAVLTITVKIIQIRVANRGASPKSE